MRRRGLTPTPLLVAAGAPFVLVVGGTLGCRLLEGWPWFDALYMAVITLTTVGFGETHPLGTAGRVFTICFVLSGVFTLFFTTTDVFHDDP